MSKMETSKEFKMVSSKRKNFKVVRYFVDGIVLCSNLITNKESDEMRANGIFPTSIGVNELNGITVYYDLDIINRSEYKGEVIIPSNKKK